MKLYWQILLICSFLNAVYSDGDTVAATHTDDAQPQAETASNLARQTEKGATTTSSSDSTTHATAKAGQDRKSLIDFLVANPNAKSCRASTHMQKFIETHKLQALPSLNLLDFQRYLRSVDPSIDPKNVADIHPHYLRYVEFIRNLKSRNRLVKYLKDNPDATLLEISTRMEEFLSGHKLFETNSDISDPELATLMKSRDNFISDAQINLLSPKVKAYLTYYGKAKARDDLLKAIDKDKSVALSKIKEKMDVFINKFRMTELASTSTEAETKAYITSQDHFVYPEDVDLIYPIYIKYIEHGDRARVRDALLAKINAETKTLINNRIIYQELEEFMTKYHLKEADVSDTSIFEKIVREQDFEISPQQIAEIQPYAKRHKFYGNRAAIRTSVKAFIAQNPTATPLALQPYMTPFIEAFELAETNDITSFVARINEYETSSVVDATSENTLFTKFTSFKEFYRKKDTFIKLLEYIKTTTTVDANILAGHINTFLGQFTGWSDDIYYVDAFIKKIKEFDSSILDEDIKTVHAQVKSHKIETVKDSCRSELRTELERTDKNQDIINLKIDILVAVFGLQDGDLSTDQTFISKIKSIDAQAVDAQLSIFYQPVKNRMESKEFKDKVAAMMKVSKPGDIGEDDKVTPPEGGFKRFWYNFFEFFGAKPHKVSGVKSHSELFVFKRWFNAIYKWLTDIDFYILTDAPVDDNLQNDNAQSTNTAADNEDGNKESNSDVIDNTQKTPVDGNSRNTQTDGATIERQSVDGTGATSDTRTQLNDAGDGNVAAGGNQALLNNIPGGENQAAGVNGALRNNAAGDENEAAGGNQALRNNAAGDENEAAGGNQALRNNVPGGGNQALLNNVPGRINRNRVQDTSTQNKPGRINELPQTQPAGGIEAAIDSSSQDTTRNNINN